jgi:hypothetical protein
MTRLTLTALVLTICSPNASFGADPKTQEFDGEMGRVFDATVKAVESNWKKVNSSDRAAGTVQFHTGVSMSTWGEDCTVVLHDLGNGKTEVSLKSKNSAQLYAWGVGNRIADKLFKSIRKEVTRTASGTQKSPPASAQKH